MSLFSTGRAVLSLSVVTVWLLVAWLLLEPTASVARSRSGEFDRLMERARLLRKVGQQHEAIKLYRRAITLRPRSSAAHAKLGFALYEIGDFDQAIKEEQEAIRLNPKDANAYHHLGAIYLRLNMLPEAADQFRMSLSLDPKKKCNCGPVEGLLMRYPPRTKDSVMTPEEADRILSNPPARKSLSSTAASIRPNSPLVK